MMQQETKQKILNITLTETVEKKAEMVSLKENTGIMYMLNEKKVDQLKMMY